MRSAERAWPSVACFVRVGVVVALSACARSAGQSPSQTEAETPRRTGVVETTRIGLLLLDVEVTDREGRPIHGLTRDDFTVQLDLRRYEVYSVDDLCPEEPSPPLERAAAEASVSAVASPSADTGLANGAEIRAAARATRVVLYFDYAHLDGAGRERAAAEARRWVRESMRPGDEAAVFAYADQPGLQEIVRFTSDAERLTRGISAVAEDPRFLDGFALGFPARMERCCARCGESEPICCHQCCPKENCSFDAREEYQRGKHSLTALRNLLQSMEAWPGSKALILFHQQLNLAPGQLYGFRKVGQTFDRVGDHHALVDAVAAEANLSRTTVTAAFVGDYLDPHAFVPTTAVAFGHNLAEFTGGRFNKGEFDLAETADRAGRSTCVYRVALKLPERLRGQVLQAKVWVRDRLLDARYRVRLLSETDRWWRQAQNLLRRPELARDVPLAVDVLPRLRDAKGWNVEARVALDPEHLTYLPASGAAEGDLELGALLSRGAEWTREMLARSTLRRQADAASAKVVLTREFSGIAPGDYRLGAFVRDRLANAFGASANEIHLPRRGSADLAGPLAVIAASPHLRSALPLLKEKRVEGLRAARAEAPLPLLVDAIARRTPVEFMSWICPESPGAPPGEILRFVAGEDGPLFRFDTPRLAAAGECFLLADPVRTESLEPGRYEYVLRWSPGAGTTRIERQLEFRIVEPSATVPENDAPEDAANGVH